MTSKPATNRNIAEKIGVLIGAIILLGILLSGWFPRSCPLLRQALSACPSAHLVVPLTNEEKELSRIGHEDIPGNTALFSVKSQDFRGTTDVKFDYWADLKVEKAYLQVKKNGAFSALALITHPLLVDLTWARIGNSGPPESLFQRTPTYDSIDAFKANLPPAKEVAVDTIIAQHWHLQPSQYTDIDSLSNLDGINYVMTTFVPPVSDGSWKFYNETFDTQDALVSPTGTIDWAIYKPINNSATIPFHLGTVHIDYKRMQP